MGTGSYQVKHGASGVADPVCGRIRCHDHGYIFAAHNDVKRLESVATRDRRLQGDTAGKQTLAQRALNLALGLLNDAFDTSLSL